MTSPAVTPSAARQLIAFGQSVWLDYISRDLVRSGRLARMVEAGEVTGMTSNPTIFEKAIAGCDDYRSSLDALAHGAPITPYDAFVSLAVEDIKGAADALRPVFDRTRGIDGYISLELPPGIEDDTAASIAEARRLSALVARPNVMIKVPGTAAGVPVVTELTAAGVNPNITLLFAVPVYEQFADAYIAGLERRHAAGLPLDSVASVASFFVSRVDTAVDKLLPEQSPLRGRVAVANARYAYERFLAIFSGPRWARLAAAGARVQRPLWASTGTKNPAYSDVLYVQDLIAPDTVNTMPEHTLEAVCDHLRVEPTIVSNFDDARRVLAETAESGVSLGQVTGRLLIDGLAAFQADFEKLLARVGASLAAGRAGGPGAASLGPIESDVRAALDTLAKDDTLARIWKRDHTVWKTDPTEIANRLGWLDIAERMQSAVPELTAFAREAVAEGFRHAMLLGMGGSSLAPEVFSQNFGTAPGSLALHVLDTTDPAQIAAAEAAVDLPRTLFIVSSKSGGTIETLSQFDYFWAKAPRGGQYVVVTDPGSALEALGRTRGVRRVFHGDPAIGGRYSAVSMFGLVPAALIGADIETLVESACEMATACGPILSPSHNPAAWLGAVLGAAAKRGRDKLTLVLPSGLHALGPWIEQLVAESTGKEGTGILPVVGEDLGPPGVYGSDRLFVAIGDDPRLAALAAAGHPVVRLPDRGAAQLGGELFRWELATAVAGALLHINPFDQPNVQEAKDATNRILGGQPAAAATPSLAAILAGVQPCDYVAITAYLPREPDMEARLQRVRLALRDRLRVATTVGFGPRFLHSTGQLHKGGPNEGVFLQVVDEGGPDLAIPGKPYTFRQLETAQASGDLASLTAHDRRVARVTLAEVEAELSI